MKTDQLIVQYLYNNKQVTLQDIGRFTISPDVNISAETEKDTALPADSIVFEYDPKALQDEGLVNYIVQQTRKIKPLAASDLESFIILNKQFLNIGKPLVLEGLGTLQKTQIGDYSFTQAGTSHVMHEEVPKLVTEKENETITFRTPDKERSTGGGKAALLILIVLLILGAGATAWYFMNKSKNEPVSAVTASDTTDVLAISARADSLKKAHEDSLKLAVLNAPDTNSFYVVIKDFTERTAAEKSLTKLQSYGNKVFLYSPDSAHFKIRMPFTEPVTDTLRIKDSISKFFGARAYIELPRSR